MRNIQDLKEKIFFESRNIIGILDKISNVDELSSRQDLVEELASRISFLRLLEKNIEYFGSEHTSSLPESNENFYSFAVNSDMQEEEAVFNNELNEIDENEPEIFSSQVNEEEAIFNNQLNEIVEGELHETLVNFAEENSESNSQHGFMENEAPEKNPEGEKIEEEAVFNNQLNEIEKFENEISDHENEAFNHFEEEERIQDHFESNIQKQESSSIEETEEEYIPSNMTMEQGEMATDTSNAENILNEIKHEAAEEEKQEQSVLAEINDKRKIVEITPVTSEDNKIIKSDESFENLEAYHHDRKIKLSNIKGLKMVQSLFDDDHLEGTVSPEKPKPAEKKEDAGSIAKTNMPTDFMEAEKKKPEFRLDLNDRIAFSKTLFGGSQSELNEVVAVLNSFKTLEEAKEYLSDLYYARKWSKVDEYAQRLWILVENKFL